MASLPNQFYCYALGEEIGVNDAIEERDNVAGQTRTDGLVAVKISKRECFVVAPDPANAANAIVIMTDELPSTTCAFKSIALSNLSPSTYAVRIGPSTIATAGNGLFATRPFAEGEIILQEKPFLTMRRDFGESTHAHTDDEACDAFADKVRECCPSAAARSVLQRLTLGPLRIVDKDSMMKQHVRGCSSITTVGSKRSRATTGDCEVTKCGQGHAIREESGCVWASRMAANGLSGARPHPNTSALYPLMCTVNHACADTAAHNAAWDMATDERTLVALRRIDAGEELFVDYFSGEVGAQRRERRRRYGITGRCSCAMCSEANVRLWDAFHEACGEAAWAAVGACVTARNRQGAAEAFAACAAKCDGAAFAMTTVLKASPFYKPFNTAHVAYSQHSAAARLLPSCAAQFSVLRRSDEDGGREEAAAAVAGFHDGARSVFTSAVEKVFNGVLYAELVLAGGNARHPSDVHAERPAREAIGNILRAFSNQ